MKEIWINAEAGDFAENKDIAARLRENIIAPALGSGEQIRLDFTNVDGVTQSFMHALISQPIRQDPACIENIEFHGCNPIVRSIIEMVVDYSQWEFKAPSASVMVLDSGAEDSQE